MAILLKCGAVFLHIPKTGGSWVTEVLEEQGLARRRIGHIHADMDRVLRYLNLASTVAAELGAPLKSRLPVSTKRSISRLLRGESGTTSWPGQSDQIDRTPYIFCFVRHPISWYESFWRYMQRWDWPRLGNPYDVNDWHPKAFLNGLGSSDFNQFIRNVLRERPGYLSELYGWYVRPGVSFVGYQEHLVEDLLIVLRDLGLDFDETKVRSRPRVNRSSQKDGTEIIWDQNLREELLRVEAAALARFEFQ